MLGILPDIHALGQVEYLVQRMQAEPWSEFWQDLGLTLLHFEDVGLSATSPDADIWQLCQDKSLIFVTNNRNARSSDSLEETIRQRNKLTSLPVFTISDLKKPGFSRSYADQVIASLYDYLLRLDSIRGAGRIYLP